MSISVSLPRIMHIGKNACEQIPAAMSALGVNTPLIVTDKMMVKLGYVARITDILTAAGISADIYDDTVPEPTEQSIMGGVEMVRRGAYDCIIALGGGSPIDSAKAIAILGKYGGVMRDYAFPRMVNETGLPLIAVPTTAGTGSECTRVTVITDEAANEKLMCMGLGFLPAAAVVDYTLTMSVPPRTTADTGIDALTHAVEAYVSKKANPFSDIQALAAMRLIGPNLRTVYHEGSNEAAREAVMLGSMLAGMAFTNASVALVHGMSRPIGAFFHVPHGLSNAMLLPTVTAYSIPAAEKRYAECARAIGVAAATDSDAAANDKLLAELNALNRELSVPTLAGFGVDKQHFDSVIDTMAAQALASGSPANNPRVPEHAEIIELYRKLW